MVLLLVAACRPPRLEPTRVLEQLREATAPVPMAVGAALDAEQAVALALANNPSLGPLRESVAVARGELSAAADIENPTLRIQRTELNLASRAGWQLALRWAPPRPWELATKRDRARAGIERADEELLERQLELASDVRREHASLGGLDRELEVAAAGADARRALVALVEARVQRGVGTRLDVATARFSLAQAEAAKSELAAQRVATAERLRGLLGLAPGAPLSVKPSAPVPASLPSRAAMEDLALSARPLLKAELARYSAQTDDVALAYFERLPWFKIIAGPRLDLVPYAQRASWTVGLELYLPLLDWNGGHIELEEAKLRREAARYRAELADLRRDIAVALADLEADRAAVEALEKQVLPALEDRLDAAKKGFEAQQFDAVQRLDAEDDLWKARRQVVRANRELQQAWFRLQRIVGAPWK